MYVASPSILTQDNCRYTAISDLTKGDGKKSKDHDGPPQRGGNMCWDTAKM